MIENYAEDAINATKAAVEEGIVPGGGSTLTHLSLDLEEWAEDNLEADELVGALIVEKAMTSPIRRIIENTGKSSSIITETIKIVSLALVMMQLKENCVICLK